MSPTNLDHFELLHRLNLSDFLYIVCTIILSWILATFVRWFLRRVAESVSAKFRLPTLRLIPLMRVTIFMAAMIIIIPIIVEPTLQNVIALLAASSLVIAFVLKDYASSLFGGLVTVFENAYQPGDWIEMDDTYGEVKLISLRAVHIVTPKDDEVMIPHYRFWTKKISNCTNGSRNILCEVSFYLHPDHDGYLVCSELEKVAKSSAYIKPNSKVVIAAQEQPWGTHYKIKAYALESREQFMFTTDLTLRGKEALRKENLQFAQYVPLLLNHK